jgi:hypothetical protein
MTAPDSVDRLINRFLQNQDDYISAHYNEAQARQEFINPLFKALGWDVDNEQGYAEAYKDVVHEDSVQVEGRTKAPDYSFRIGGTRKFFLEAKKPNVNIGQDSSSAFQLRRYAWSNKLPLSVLTNFRQFAVYDGRIRPSRTDPASRARILCLDCTSYRDRWSEIYDVFARESVLRGSFDRYAAGARTKRGTSEVDSEFLREIQEWRTKLAMNLALRNRLLSQKELNYAVQSSINRIIFLRICEDRGLEPYGRLRDVLAHRVNLYNNLVALFGQADTRYNSGLFHFSDEPDRPQTADHLTPGLTVDDRVIQEIIGGLYYPDSPYEFSVFPAEILGQVYEQFLGQIITLSPTHHAAVEDKPEVRKAGGVFYTPEYIVREIVDRTLSLFLDGHTPRTAGRLRIVDPACGSGSFLIAAYQCLLDWRRDWYVEDGPEKHRRQIYQTQGGKWRLMPAERKRILLDNIYGVDVDGQAVEVAKLSLLLKLLEEQDDVTMRQYELVHERVLPDLGNNVKCGNSLIGPDFYADPEVTEAARLQANCFDWASEFRAVFSSGGFDVIIGNPPYIRIQTLTQEVPGQIRYFRENYRTAQQGNYDIYALFVEKALALLSRRGRAGFILPHKFFTAHYGEPLRELLSEGRHLSRMVSFGHEQVFTQASTYTCLLFLSKAPSKSVSYCLVKDLVAWRIDGTGENGEVSSRTLSGAEWHFMKDDERRLYERLSAMPTNLEDATLRIFQGLKTSLDEVYILDEVERSRDSVTAHSSHLGEDVTLEPTLLHDLVKGGDSKPFHLSRSRKIIIFPYALGDRGQYELIPQTEMRSRYPLTWAYLNSSKRALRERENGRFDGEHWYQYGRTQALQLITKPKLFTPDIALRASFSIDETGDAFFTGGVAGGYGILPKAGISQFYLLGILNSRLLEWFLRRHGTSMRGGYYNYESRFIKGIPVPLAEPAEGATATAREEITVEATTITRLCNLLAGCNVPQQVTNYERQRDAAVERLNATVYRLYGLSQEETRVVERDFN